MWLALTWSKDHSIGSPGFIKSRHKMWHNGLLICHVVVVVTFHHKASHRPTDNLAIAQSEVQRSTSYNAQTGTCHKFLTKRRTSVKHMQCHKRLTVKHYKTHQWTWRWHYQIRDYLLQYTSMCESRPEDSSTLPVAVQTFQTQFPACCPRCVSRWLLVLEFPPQYM